MKLDMNIVYPDNKFKYRTFLKRLNWEERMKKDFETGKGFRIGEPGKYVNNTLERDDSPFSIKFGPTPQDPNAFTDRYSCQCKRTQGRDFKDSICPYCNTKVIYTGDDLQMTGWIDIHPYHIIHPNMYMCLEKYIGKDNLELMLIPDIELDENGNPMTKEDQYAASKTSKARRGPRKSNTDFTYANIGMIEFYNKFDEILEYFHSKNKQKKEDIYEDILANRDIVFQSCIPVYTAALRPWKLEGGRLTFEKTNSIYVMLAKQGAKIVDDSKSLYRSMKYKNSVAWDIQDRLMTLVTEVINILRTKKGQIRSLLAGRCCFIARAVIRPDPSLAIDQVRLPYYALLELLQQTIINILVRTYNMGESDAYMRFSNARRVPDKQIMSIIQNFLNTVGMNVLINRN